MRADGKLFHGVNHGYDTWLTPAAWHRAHIGRACNSAKVRARKKKVRFSISIEYLMSIFPADALCPIFGTPLSFGPDKNTSPSLDRVRPELGYVPGNLMWISNYANTLKTATHWTRSNGLSHFMKTS